MKKRESGIDLLRIFCCLFVIGIHVLMDYRLNSNGTLNYGVVFTESFLRCAVPCFIIISGYFLFQKDLTVREVLSKTFFRLVMPTLAICAMIHFFSPWLYGYSIEECIQKINLEKIRSFVCLLLAWELPEPGFWLGYMRTLIQLYLLYPILKFICIDKPAQNHARWFLMIITFMGQFCAPYIRDVTFYVFYPFESYGILYFLMGYELWRMRSVLTKKSITLMAGVAYIGMAVITFVLTINANVGKIESMDQVHYGYTSINVALEGVALTICFMGMLLRKQINGGIQRAIAYLSQRTFVIYLIHYLVLIYFHTVELDESLFYYFGLEMGCVFMIFGCFAVSGIISVLAHMITLVFMRRKRKR